MIEELTPLEKLKGIKTIPELPPLVVVEPINVDDVTTNAEAVNASLANILLLANKDDVTYKVDLPFYLSVFLSMNLASILEGLNRNPVLYNDWTVNQNPLLEVAMVAFENDQLININPRNFVSHVMSIIGFANDVLGGSESVIYYGKRTGNDIVPKAIKLGDFLNNMFDYAGQYIVEPNNYNDYYLLINGPDVDDHVQTVKINLIQLLSKVLPNTTQFSEVGWTTMLIGPAADNCSVKICRSGKTLTVAGTFHSKESAADESTICSIALNSIAPGMTLSQKVYASIFTAWDAVSDNGGTKIYLDTFNPYTKPVVSIKRSRNRFGGNVDFHITTLIM